MVLAQGSYKPKTKIGRQYLLPKKKLKQKTKSTQILKIILLIVNIVRSDPKCIQNLLSYQ